MDFVRSHFRKMNLWPVEHPPKSDDKYAQKVFNWSEVHLSEVTSYKIHTLDESLMNWKMAFEKSIFLTNLEGCKAMQSIGRPDKIGNLNLLDGCWWIGLNPDLHFWTFYISNNRISLSFIKLKLLFERVNKQNFFFFFLF